MMEESKYRVEVYLPQGQLRLYCYWSGTYLELEALYTEQFPKAETVSCRWVGE